jgi:hypothetical protein
MAVLLTFCLTTTLSMIDTTKSQEYNPWADLNGDGKIDILDVVQVTGIYATTGDPTKNVTIAGRANKLAYSVAINVAAYSYLYSSWISVNGYSKVSVCISNNANHNRYMLATSHNGGYTFYADNQTDFGTDLVKTYDVPNEQIQVQFTNLATYEVALYMDIYLIP